MSKPDSCTEFHGPRSTDLSRVSMSSAEVGVQSNPSPMRSPNGAGGASLAEELGALSMSAAELARQRKLPTNRVTEILNGQRASTGDTTLRLGCFFGTSPEFWLNLQRLY